MNTTLHRSGSPVAAGELSLFAISLTVILASITHAYDFGVRAFVVGALGVGLLTGLNLRYRRTGGLPSLVFYGLLNAWIIVGFGVVGGFWNHGVKVAIVALHGGVMPAGLELFFMTPDVGSVFFETVGILTFVASVFAALSGARLVRAIRAEAAREASAGIP